jgi:hypothetical protein
MPTVDRLTGVPGLIEEAHDRWRCPVTCHVFAAVLAVANGQPKRNMDFLEHNEICAWATERGLRCGTGLKLQLPEFESQARKTYANGHRSGLEGAAARDLVASLGSWDECLVCITGWGVWPSGEDWPQFYAWRGALVNVGLLTSLPDTDSTVASSSCWPNCLS